jgi:N-acetylmuramoyl-L-alanine amidase
VSSEIKKAPVMSVFHKFHTIKQNFVVMFLVVIFLCAFPKESSPEKMIFGKHKKIIVLDPGHGGYDNGAKGPDGTFEKNVTLSLARIMAEAFGDKYKVILTRTDDYWLDIPARTAAANHLEADLFICIHTGGSFLHQASGMSLYYYKETSGPILTLNAEPSEPKKSTNKLTPWTNIQKKHQATSKSLAELIQNRINEQIIIIESKIQGAQLEVLEGADMPAILVEIGYITNPADEKLLNDMEFLSDVARVIRSSIDDFFEKVQQPN